MEQFRTIVTSGESKDKISYNSKIFFLGSCFADNIGNYFLTHKFSTLINPFGVVYNPASIKTCIEFLLQRKKFDEDDLFFYNYLWSSYYHHSSFSNENKEKCLENINNKIIAASEFLKNTCFMFITFGSAKVYELDGEKIIVSNCHKLPAKRFKSYLLKPSEIADSYRSLISCLISYNPAIKIIFTISPVRYLNYGNFTNSVSKSALFIAIEELTGEFKNTAYFPAYEIMSDDLRDYRFYKEDMIHPNDIAIKYIWEKMCETYIARSTMNIINEVGSILRAKNHRPVNASSPAYRKFISQQVEKIKKIQNKYKDIDLIDEIDFFEKQLLS